MSSRRMHARAVGVTAHSAHARGDRPLAVVGRWMLLFVSLAGLFAMHGLSDHGVGGPAAVSQTAAAATEAGPAPDMGRDGSAMHPAGVGPHARATATPISMSSMHGDPGALGQHGGHGGHGGLLAGMCMAVLAALLLLAAGALWRRALITLGSRFGHLRTTLGTALLARSRGPAPPDMRMLSIQRC